MWSIHVMERYSALRRKEILTQATTWVILEDIILKEASHKRTNIVQFHLELSDS